CESFSLLCAASVDPRPLHSFPTRRSSDLSRDARQRFVTGHDASAFAHGDVMSGIERDGREMAKGAGQSAAIAGTQRVAIVLDDRSEEHTSELQSRFDLVCRLLLEKKKRHFVFLANRVRQEKLAQRRSLLLHVSHPHPQEATVALEPPTVPSAEPAARCSVCQHMRL